MEYTWAEIDLKIEDLVKKQTFLQDPAIPSYIKTNCRYCNLYYPMSLPTIFNFYTSQYLHLIEFHRAQTVNLAIHSIALDDYEIAAGG